MPLGLRRLHCRQSLVPGGVMQCDEMVTPHTEMVRCEDHAPMGEGRGRDDVRTMPLRERGEGETM